MDSIDDDEDETPDLIATQDVGEFGLSDSESEGEAEVGLRNPGQDRLAQHQVGRVQPESSTIPLPSSMGQRWIGQPTSSTIVKQEIGLRIGQANDALHQIRIALAEKSFMFRTQIRNARSQQKKTRAWDSLHSLEANVKHHARIYSRARSALAHLGADAEILHKYKVLRKEDLKVSTAVVDVRLPNRSESTLAWFWTIDVRGDTDEQSWMSECELCCQIYCPSS
jgi:hypothetical protein